MTRRHLLAALALAAAPVLAAAQGSMGGMNMSNSSIAPLKADVLANMKTVTDKWMQLADAMPADKYTWRPGTGVRSVAEVFLHISNAQYIFGASIGVKSPAGWDMKTFETSTTDKAQIMAAMRAAFAAMTAAIGALPDNGGDTAFKLFGQDFNTRKLLVLETDHNAEHLGQMIAYARVNGVVPPWSAKAGM
jgi:uncharacterized damage-inducible protein DinB